MSALRGLALSVLLPGFTGTVAPDWVRRALADGLAGVCLFGHNVGDDRQVRALTRSLREERADAVVASDEEGGSVSRLDAGLGSPWPGAAALGALDDLDATRAVARGIGGQARASGVDLVLAPVLDVASEPDNPVIGVRSFGADPGLVARHGVAFVDGLRDAGVLGCAKHFPGHGATRTDSHVDLPVLDVDEATWRARDLVPFRAAVDAGVPAVMTAHVVVPALDGAPATTSARVLGILRDELGFDGAVVSDALDMRAISDRLGRAAGAVRALAAGVDLLCLGNPSFPDGYDEVAAVEEVVAAVVAAVETGDLPRARLEEASRRVATLARPDAEVAAAPRSEMLAAGAAVARRALTVRGDVRLTGDDVLVVSPRPVTGYAAGHRPSALVAELRRRRPAWRYADTCDPREAAAEAGSADGGAVLLVVESPDGRPDGEVAAAVLSRAPGAVVAYAGPCRPDHPGARTVHSHGAGAAAAVATADVLLGEDPS